MHLPFAAGLSHFAGSLHLIARPLTFYLLAAWTTACPSLFSSSPCINSMRRWDYCYPPPHICSDLGPLHMPLHCEVMHSLSNSDAFGSHDRSRFLQEVVTGIEGGHLHGIPWQVLPSTRSFVKERLALAALSNCRCNFTFVLWP